MNIVIVTSEVVPFAKTGGLADVCGALPQELQRLGHDVVVFAPAYRQARQCGQQLSTTGIELDIPIGNKPVSGRLLKSVMPNSSVPVYLVERNEYFDRPSLYGENGEDYKDNCERFVFFSRAVLEGIRLLELDVDVIHINDWQTGLIPAYLQIEYSGAPGFERISTLMTLHNIAYQGQFWHWDMLVTGLDWKYFNWHQMEYYGNLNLLKTGIVFSDLINTVSPTYAEEIQSSPLGCGLENVLFSRRESLNGIVNGIDTNRWNPATDPALAQNYDPYDWQTGKAECKRALQRDMGLPEQHDEPLVGLIGRLTSQKGYDLVAPLIEDSARSSNTQWVILGTGEPRYHKLFDRLSKEFPDKVTARLEFSDPLAHQIEAGSDLFLMPSEYEPCGLNQLYSLAYGTVPVVRETGGLSDTIVDASDDNLSNGTANGFTFPDFSTPALATAFARACDTYRHRKDLWQQLVETGMRQDWSWSRVARSYESLYKNAMKRVERTVCV